MKLEQHETLKNLLKTLTDCVELKHSSFRLSLALFFGHCLVFLLSFQRQLLKALLY